MGKKVIGKLDDWGDADLGGNDFMNLEEGDNVVRLITAPFQFYIHWTKDSTGANRKVRCALDDCPICQAGERSQARWYVGVMSRKSLSCAILEIGPQIFKQVLGLSKDEDWGNPRKYDINIKRQPKGSQPLYVVIPIPPKALTDEQKTAAKEFTERVNISAMIEAPSPAEVREKVGLPSQASDVDNDFEDPASEDFSDDDDDFDFDD